MSVKKDKKKPKIYTSMSEIEKEFFSIIFELINEDEPKEFSADEADDWKSKDKKFKKEIKKKLSNAS